MSAFHTGVNRLRTTTLLKVVDETRTVKSFFFDDSLSSDSSPGQFLMIWIPGVDEIPLSVSSAESGTTSVAVANVGEASEALHSMKRGDVIGVRGPFGNCFKPVKGKAMIVGGGTGMAPLAFLTEKLASHSRSITVLAGAEAEEDLLFVDRLKRSQTLGNVHVAVSTMDGSRGEKGPVTIQAEKLLNEQRFRIIYTCGPELMMYKMFKLAVKHTVPLQASLERLMRCAIGLCGTCAVGKYLVCKDGPVFTDSQLKQVNSEFGRLKRNFDGSATQF